ncbi:MAG TPA: ROK family protein [Pirellulales bacterium]|nr:ROK family protein [Pirellulales bacterium]
MPKVVKKPQAVSNLESAIVRRVSARGAISRIDLARDLGLVPSTAGIYVDRLIERGFLAESAKAARGIGRPPVLVELNPKGGRFIGVDVDARQVMAASVDFAQRPLAQACRTLPVRATVERVLGEITRSIAELIGASDRDVLGIGLGVPGPIDAERGVSRRYEFIRDWVDVPIRERIAASFRAPVFVENNIRAMALGELWCGQGRGLRHLVCLGVRSGIGSGIVVDGKLLAGASNTAGEIGRWPCPEWQRDAKSFASVARTHSQESPVGHALRGVPRNKVRVSNAPREERHGGRALQSQRENGEVPLLHALTTATIEDVASLTAILARAAEELQRGRTSSLGSPGEAPTAQRLMEAAGEGDDLACELIEQAARIHGRVVHQLALLLDPECVIVAGPLSESDAYLATLRQHASRFGGQQIGAKVVRSTLGALGGALGAAALAFHYWKPRR